jgi:hypothetical protein
MSENSPNIMNIVFKVIGSVLRAHIINILFSIICWLEIKRSCYYQNKNIISNKAEYSCKKDTTKHITHLSNTPWQARFQSHCKPFLMSNEFNCSAMPHNVVTACIYSNKFMIISKANVLSGVVLTKPELQPLVRPLA